jgi:ATP-dependent RNA helicase DDX27
MKELIKEAETKKKSATNNTDARSGVIRTRTIPQAVVSHMAAKIQSLRPHVKEILEAEAVARMDRVADMEAVKALNIIEHSSEIQSRPQKEWFMSNKDKKLSKEAIAEKQKIIAEKVGTGTHRMTRKKRRAREALRGLESHGRCDDDGDESDKGNASSNKQTVNLERQIKSAVKKKKKADQEKERETSQKSVHDIDTEKVQRAAKKQKKSGKDAVGDSGLFADEKVAFSSRKKEATPVAKSSFEFRGYDPSQKFGKKKGVHKFKSKSKYKRK